MNRQTFNYNAPAVLKYTIITYYLIGLLMCGVGMILIWVLLRLGLKSALKDTMDNLVYEVDDDALRVKKQFHWGLLKFKSDKAIPLNKITDLKLVQGPIQTHCDIWAIHVQTAGVGQHMPEAILYGLDNPHDTRELILDRIREHRKSYNSNHIQN